MEPTELGILKEILLELLTPNNEARKLAEVKLAEIRDGSPEKYALGMCQVFADEDFDEGARSLGLVLFRRGVTSDTDISINVWRKLSQEAKEQVKNATLQLLKTIRSPVLTKQIADLASELAETIFVVDKAGIWDDVLNLAYEMVSANVDPLSTRTGLNIYNYLFAHMSNELSKYNDKFVTIFQASLDHPDLSVAEMALAAVCNYLTIAQSKYTQSYAPCLEGMVKVPLRGLEADDEKVIEDAMVEFNNVAEAEPKFFVEHYKSIFLSFTKIVEKNDYANPSIRHQPLEFLVSIADRQTSLITEDEDMLKGLLDLICKLMIDVDQEIDEEWANPPPGFKLSEEQEDDSIVFALECINRIFHAGGEDVVLGPVCVLIENLLSNENDWRFKNAGLHILSQIGDFVNDCDLLKGSLMDALLAHSKHENPKIRHAFCHVIGQLSMDLKKTFTEEFATVVVPALHERLSDPVIRVQAHACAAFSNFFENVNKDVGNQSASTILPILIEFIKTGSSILKENAVTTISAIAEACDSEFQPYYAEVMQMLLTFLTEKVDASLKQFKGQLIEAITIISVCVGMETFTPFAPAIIEKLLEIQNNHLDTNYDPQRQYLMSAWQRLCMIMEKEFIPYLPKIVPSLFQQAALKPVASIGGQTGDILDFLAEVKVDTSGQTISVKTDEIDEKNTAIQMLTVFIEELEEGFAEYIEPTSELFLSLIDYSATDQIRDTVAHSLPICLKSLIKASPQDRERHLQFANIYM